MNYEIRITRYELRDTNYEIFLMLNIERRLKNEEVGIRVRTQMVLLKVLGTLYFVQCTACIF